MPASACLGPVRVYVTETARRETSMLGSRGCSRLALLLGGPRASRASAILAPPLSRGRPTLPLLSANPVGITLPSLASIPSVVRLSSSLAGMESAGLPRMQRTASGQSQGVAKGGKGRKNLGGVLAIKNTWNNTLVSISNTNYKQLGFVSGGTVGFKKSKRASQFATEKAISEAFAKAKSVGIRRVMISMSGPAISLRKPLFKQIREQVGLRIVKLRMVDNVPHGGCRPRKSRRRRWKTKARRR